MIICICNNVSEKEIKSALKINPVSSVEDLKQNISVCNQCETCYFAVKDLIDEHDKKKDDLENIVTGIKEEATDRINGLGSVFDEM